MSSLKDLEKRLEECTGINDDDEAVRQHAINNWIHYNLMPEPKVIQPLCYCASLDAAVSLAERQFPGWRIAIVKHDVAVSKFVGRAFISHTARNESYEAEAATLALALCLALVRALIAKGGASD